MEPLFTHGQTRKVSGVVPMRFEGLQKRLSTLEDSFGKAAFSVVLERAVFKRGESRIVGTILVKAGSGGYIAI